MITFEPDSPWEVGQVVIFRDDQLGTVTQKVITAVEHSEDGMESQYTFQDAAAVVPLGLTDHAERDQ